MKCTKCGTDSPVSIAGVNEKGDIETLCLDCHDEEIKGFKYDSVPPPYGWMGPIHEADTMRHYAQVQWCCREC